MKKLVESEFHSYDVGLLKSQWGTLLAHMYTLVFKHRNENFGNNELHSGAKKYAADHPHAPVNLNMTHEDIENYRDCVNLCAAYGDYSESDLEDEV